MTGGCLCGAVRYAIDAAQTPIELCHCSRCRKACGSAFAATLYVRADAFRWLDGADRVRVYEAPIRESPPAYCHVFCADCGAPLPIAFKRFGVVEIPVGGLDGDPGVRPLRHIHTAGAPAWQLPDDGLPRHPHGVPPSEHLIRRLL